jgi:hypothetical protein
MTAIKIGRNTTLEQQHRLQLVNAENRLQQAIELLKISDIEIKNKEQFAQGFTAYVKAYLQQHKVLKHLDHSTLVNWSQLQQLETDYKRFYVPMDLVDYDLYATTDQQIQAYKYALRLQAVMNEHPLKGQGTNVPFLTFVNGSYEVDTYAILTCK